mgnify:CR=1 FL=1
MTAPVIATLTLTYSGRQYVQTIRLPDSTKSIQFGRNHRFGDRYPYRNVGVVSGTHFVIQAFSNRTMTITDTSSNGTFVNQQPLHRGRTLRLNDGDQITLVGPNQRTGVVDVKFNTSGSLTKDELNMVRRYVELLSDPAAVASHERKNIDQVCVCAM